MQPGVERAGTVWVHRAAGLDGWAGPVGLGYPLEETVAPQSPEVHPAQEYAFAQSWLWVGVVWVGRAVSLDNPDRVFLAFHSLGCGIGYGYLHRIPTQPSSHYKKPAGASPSGTPPANTPQLNALPLGAPPPWPVLQDSSGPELGSRHSDYMEVCGEHLSGQGREEYLGAVALPAVSCLGTKKPSPWACEVLVPAHRRPVRTGMQ